MAVTPSANTIPIHPLVISYCFLLYLSMGKTKYERERDVRSELVSVASLQRYQSKNKLCLYYLRG